MHPKGLILLTVLSAAAGACGPQGGEEAPDMAAADPAWPGTEAADAAEDFYRDRVVGRWSELTGCGGMTWNFEAGRFTTPGETHCAAVTAAQGPGDAVRLTGADCQAEGAAQPDMVLDVTVQDEMIGVAGVGNGVATQGWLRC